MSTIVPVMGKNVNVILPVLCTLICSLSVLVKNFFLQSIIADMMLLDMQGRRRYHNEAKRRQGRIQTM